MNGKQDVMRLLCEAGADMSIEDAIGCTPLHRAVVPVEGVNGSEMVRLCVEMGGDATERSSKGFSALHIACTMGTHEVVRTLVDLGAEIDAIDNEGIPFFSLPSLYLAPSPFSPLA